MNTVTAHRLVAEMEDNLEKCVQDLVGIRRTADDYVEWASDILEEQQDCDTEAQTEENQKK